MRMDYHGKSRRGDGDIVPLIVLLVIIVVVSAGFVLANQFIFVEEKPPDDKGDELDADDPGNQGDPHAVLKVLDYGTIRIKLNEEKAPITVANFVKLCNEGFYDGLTFHRLIPGFMIQGGEPSGDGTGGPGYTIESEADNGLSHERGVIAMAKKSTDVRMSGSQFYITVDKATHLDGEHTVFGKVVEGMNVVDKIVEAPTDNNDKPIQSVIIERAYIEYE